MMKSYHFNMLNYIIFIINEWYHSKSILIKSQWKFILKLVWEWFYIIILILNEFLNQMRCNIQDSNNFSIGIHSFKVLVQIHYSRSPGPLPFLFFWIGLRPIGRRFVVAFGNSSAPPYMALRAILCLRRLRRLQQARGLRPLLCLRQIQPPVCLRQDLGGSAP